MSAENRRKESTEHAGFFESHLDHQSNSNIVQVVMDLQRLQRDLKNSRQQECSKASSWSCRVCFLSRNWDQGSWVLSRISNALEKNWHECIDELEHQVSDLRSDSRACQFFWFFAFLRTDARHDIKLFFGYWLIWLLGSWAWLSKHLIIRQRSGFDYQALW